MRHTQKKLCIAVLYGGRSAEREISIKTGKQVISNLDRKKYQVVPIEIPIHSNNWIIKLMSNKPDVGLLALHGQFGEDGTIQGMLEMLKIPYTCSGVLTSALAMDKYRLCEFLRTFNIKTPRGVLIHHDEQNKEQKIRKQVGLPCVVKPNRSGSSVGVTVNVRTLPGLKQALKLAFKYDEEVLVEEYIQGREITAPVLGNENPSALPLIEIIPKIGSFYNYESKYKDGGSDHIIPAPLSKLITDKIQKIAAAAHELVGARGVTRSDFILRDSTPYFLELNTIPGMTQTSLVPQSAEKASISFSKLLDKLIELAQK